jgi:hypothetical protein
VLLDLVVVPFKNDSDFVRVEVRGLHLRPTYVPAFIARPGDPAALILPLQGSASADTDSLSGIFQASALPALQTALSGTDGIVMAASEVPLAIVDGELGRIVQGPAVTTWPKLRRADDVVGDGGPGQWYDIPPNQRFVPQSPPDPVDPEVADDCLADCGDDCAGCDCGCHLLKTAQAGITRLREIINDQDVQDRAHAVGQDLGDQRGDMAAGLFSVLKGDNLTSLLDAVIAADRRRAEAATTGTEPTDSDTGATEPTDSDTGATEPAGADTGEAATTGAGAPGDQLPLYGRSEQELSAMDQLGVLLAGRRGALERRVKQIQNSREIRRFVVAALRAEQARIAGGTGPDERGQ